MGALLLSLLLASPEALPEVRAQLEAERTAARDLAARESSLLGRLAELEQKLEVEGRALRVAQVRLRAATTRLDAGERKAQAAEQRLTRQSDAVAPRLLVRYRLAREGYLRFMLGASSIADVIRRKGLVDRLLQSDLEALAELQAVTQEAKGARDELAAAHAELAASAAGEAARREEMQALADDQRRVLAQVQQERSAHEEAAHELEQAEKSLTARLGQLSSPPATDAPSRAAMVAQEIRLDVPSPRQSRGRLLFPVADGFVETRFGRAIDPRFNTVTVQNGLDIRAAAGTPVRAVWAGKVVHAGWFKGYGNLLIIDHGDGIFSLMAHLATLERTVGEALSQGDLVGTVGDTGSLKGAYLYFELRDGQKPLDPERWLQKVPKRAPALTASAKGAP
jgi:septal ring factor EnvC (AmiA/AmiB activator)